MRIIEIHNQPAIMCPITREYRVPSLCLNCDAYGGMQDDPEKPLAVYCKTDQMK